MNAAEPTSHPGADLLASYTSGWAPWAVDLCVRIHLETCSLCRKEVAVLEEEEAAFVDALPDTPLPETVMEGFLRQLEATPPATPRAPTIGGVALPKALAFEEIGSRVWIAPSFWVAPLREGRRQRWRTYLLHAPAGQALPSHSHAGMELVCVLEGSFIDTRTYRAGDFVEARRADHHRPAVAGGGPCTCLIASEGGMLATGLGKFITAALSI